MSILHWHPLIVHLPLGLWSTVPILWTLAATSRSAERAALYASAGTVNLLIGSITAAAALITGLLAATSLPLVGIAQATLTHHVMWALMTTFVYVSLTLLRTVGRSFSVRPGIAMVALVWIGTVGLLVTGYYGGRNVYGYGLGVDLATATERAAHRPPPVIAPRPTLP